MLFFSVDPFSHDQKNKLSSAGDQPCMIELFKVRLERFMEEVKTKTYQVKMGTHQVKLGTCQIKLGTHQ